MEWETRVELFLVQYRFVGLHVSFDFQKSKAWAVAWRAFYWTLGVGGILGVLFFILVAVADLSFSAFLAVAVLVFALITMGFGAVFIFKKITGPVPDAAQDEPGDPFDINPEAEQLEGQVLLLAKQCRGRITVAELAVETSFGIDEAKAALHECAQKGVAELQMTDSGHEVYLFPAFLEETGS